MTKHWKHPVICSHITAKLVLLKIRCDAKYLTALPLNQPEIIENVEVTLLDANHCPGSVMFLFKVNIMRPNPL
jgi:DNA cross-link repair 1A protein